MSRHSFVAAAPFHHSMAEAWDDESFFKQGLQAGHGVELQTSTTRFFSTTNGVPTTDCKLFECSGGGALSCLSSVALGGGLPHSAQHGDPLSQDGAHAAQPQVAQPHGEWGGGNSLMPNWHSRSCASASHHHHTGSFSGYPMHSGIAATDGITNSGWQQGVAAATRPLSVTSNSGSPQLPLPPNGNSHFLPPCSSPMGQPAESLISGFNNYQVRKGSPVHPAHRTSRTPLTYSTHHSRTPLTFLVRTSFATPARLTAIFYGFC